MCGAVACAECAVEQLDELNVHGAVVCACHQNVSLTESIAQQLLLLKDTDP